MHSRDSELFRELVGKEIKPIKKIKIVAKPPKKVAVVKPQEQAHTAKPAKKVAPPKAATAKPSGGNKAVPGITSGTDNSKKYRATGVSEQQFKTWERQARKQQDHPSIDLHGEKQKTAEPQIARFIAMLKHNKTNTGLIIHGKGLRSKQGEAVLRQLLRQMLEQNPAVKAYLTTSGGGATLVWLKT